MVGRLTYDELEVISKEAVRTFEVLPRHWGLETRENHETIIQDILPGRVLGATLHWIVSETDKLPV
jgi:hypothetical protein